MWQQMIQYFASWFRHPSLIGIALAIGFGVVWLLLYRPPIFKNIVMWLVLLSGALLTLAAVAFIQLPLQTGVGYLLGNFMGENAMMTMLWLVGIPSILISGLVQEGAKLVPVVLYWLDRGRKITPLTGLLVGAVAGAGFGMFEAYWVHSIVFAQGWSFAVVQKQGIIALAPFWERFFTVGFQIATTAIAGYGLASGWGWQFYLLASFFHALINYNVILLQAEVFTIMRVEISIAIIAVLVTLFALWLLRSASRAEEIPPPEPSPEAESPPSSEAQV